MWDTCSVMCVVFSRRFTPDPWIHTWGTGCSGEAINPKETKQPKGQCSHALGSTSFFVWYCFFHSFSSFPALFCPTRLGFHPSPLPYRLSLYERYSCRPKHQETMHWLRPKCGISCSQCPTLTLPAVWFCSPTPCSQYRTPPHTLLAVSHPTPTPCSQYRIPLQHPACSITPCSTPCSQYHTPPHTLPTSGKSPPLSPVSRYLLGLRNRSP